MAKNSNGDFNVCFTVHKENGRELTHADIVKAIVTVISTFEDMGSEGDPVDAIYNENKGIQFAAKMDGLTILGGMFSDKRLLEFISVIAGNMVHWKGEASKDEEEIELPDNIAEAIVAALRSNGYKD